MIGAADRYIELVAILLTKRKVAGGTLSDDVETSFAEELDRCWWAMTKAEQENAEQRAATLRALATLMPGGAP